MSKIIKINEPMHSLMNKETFGSKKIAQIERIGIHTAQITFQDGSKVKIESVGDERIK